MEKQSASWRRAKSSPARFDPFNSRLSRDIRNTLAESFVDGLLQADKSRYQRTAEQWFVKNLDHESCGYIQNRIKRYNLI